MLPSIFRTETLIPLNGITDLSSQRAPCVVVNTQKKDASTALVMAITMVETSSCLVSRFIAQTQR
jgi:hypothetical protein